MMNSVAVLKTIPIDRLQRGEYQPRKQFDDAGLLELSKSIAAHGIIEPLVIRKITETTYEIIAGERRWRAAMMAGMLEVPCLINDYTDVEAAAVTLIENIQRQKLTLIEEAEGYQRLLSEFHFNQNEIATLVGKSRSHIANLLRLLTLCAFVQDKLSHNLLSLGHARMLVGLDDAQQIQLTTRVIQHHWSVRKLEKVVQSNKINSQTQPSDLNVKHLENQLAEQIGTPVQLQSDSIQGGGWLKIKFYNNDTLSGLLDRLGLRYD